jgi:hypothetical protein
MSFQVQMSPLTVSFTRILITEGCPCMPVELARRDRRLSTSPKNVIWITGHSVVLHSLPVVNGMDNKLNTYLLR